MGQQVHARGQKGGVRFRVWSDTSNSYLTEEMTEEKLREWLLEEALRVATINHNATINGNIARSKQKGTSSDLEKPRSLDGPWDKEGV